MRPAGAASAASAAVWRRYPKRDSKGRVEWIHWADLDLAAAWAEQALKELDAFVVKYSGPAADASWLEGGSRAAIVTDAFAVLRSLSNAYQALNVPPIVTPTSDEFGVVNLIRSFVVIEQGQIRVRSQLMLSAARAGKPASDEMAALWIDVRPRELASDDSVVIDVRTKQTVFRGAFEAGLAFKRNAPNANRAFLALWARRPWTLIRAENETELVWSAPIVWERDRIVRKIELARPVIQGIARDPWSALVAARALVKQNNDALASEWSGQLPELSSTKSADQVRRTQEVMAALAQARSDAALNQARAQAREGLATGAGSVAGVLGVLSAVAPPAALVLAPTAAVLSAIAALAGLLLQVIPREWLAMAEVLPPRLPLPYMTTGDEGENNAPSHSVPAPPRFTRVARSSVSAPTPLDPPPMSAVLTLEATATPARQSTSVRRSTLLGPSAKNVLLAEQSPEPARTAAPSITQLVEPPDEPAPREQTLARSDTAARGKNSMSTGLAIASVGAGALLLWVATRD
ncbi:MAG: hypothetical protein U0269_30665 [Polyangiales bacterium]